MAKKDKDEAPTANGVANRDILQRLNFLYQAGVYLNTLPSAEASTSLTSPKPNAPPITSKKAPAGKKRKRSNSHAAMASDLSRTYISIMKSVGQKTTVKIDPAVKRTLCKGCNSIMIPGSTAIVRVKKSPAHGHAMAYTCTGCQTSRRIPTPPKLQVDTSVKDVPQQALMTGATSEAANIIVGDLPMEVEPTNEAKDKPMAGKRRKSQARMPPLFARDVGHVVFCGNERLTDNGLGDGVYIT
ncbi:hypothetical protein H0H87_000989 [Tephrocybe sp. NHM501043]|nr:hypothetical protein H0H87_000989 [Tephrocybe sp. NHM501043]